MILTLFSKLFDICKVLQMSQKFVITKHSILHNTIQYIKLHNIGTNTIAHSIQNYI